jgi:hypothetical protein
MGETTDLEMLGTGLKAGASIRSGNEKDKLEMANAGIADQQAKSELAAGGYNAGLVRRKGAQIQGQQIAAIGANNLTQGGTNANVVEDTAMKTEADALTTQNNAMRKAWGFQVQGASDRLQAGYAKSGGILSGIGDLAAGGAKSWDYYSDNNP